MEAPTLKRIYIDTETTGTDPNRHCIHQFACKVVIKGQVVDWMNVSFQPHPDAELDPQALEVCGVTEDELRNRALTFAQAFKGIVAMLKKHVDQFNKTDKFHWIGYNARFDADFLRAMFELMGDKYFGSFFWVPVLCVMTLAGYLRQTHRHKLVDFKNRTLWEFLHPKDRGKYKDHEWHDALFDIDRTMDNENALRQIVLGPVQKAEAKADEAMALLCKLYSDPRIPAVLKPVISTFLNQKGGEKYAIKEISTEENGSEGSKEGIGPSESPGQEEGGQGESAAVQQGQVSQEGGEASKEVLDKVEPKVSPLKFK